MTEILINPRSEKTWEERQCRQCGKTFFVRKCYTKRGQGKFCSTGCGTTYRNIQADPAKPLEVRAKISANHADVGGRNNPMYGRTGEMAPGWIDGREKLYGSGAPIWRKVALSKKPKLCEVCGVPLSGRTLHVHHKDKNRANNEIDNLTVACQPCHNNVLHPRKRDSRGRFMKEVLPDVGTQDIT